MGVMAGLVGGAVLGWIAAPAFGDLASRPLTTIGIAFIGAAVGLGIGSFAGMSREAVARR